MAEVRALQYLQHGGPEVLQIEALRIREPGFGEVLIDIAAAGVNRADCLQRKGYYPAPPGAPERALGLEFAGKVRAVGPGVQDFAPGARVMGICPGGGMAEAIVANERELMPVPTVLSLEEAAAIPEVFLTVFDAIYAQAKLQPSEILLVHAIGSGIGTAALQLGHAFGARVAGTTRSASKITRAKEAGLDLGIDTSEGGFAAALKDEFGRGADVILDTIGAKYISENLSAIQTKGRIVTIGLLGGVKGELNLGKLLAKRVSWTGSVLRARKLEERASLVQSFRKIALPLFQDGTLRPTIERVMPMSEAQRAHEMLEANEAYGKLVLSW